MKKNQVWAIYPVTIYVETPVVYVGGKPDLAETKSWVEGLIRKRVLGQDLGDTTVRTYRGDPDYGTPTFEDSEGDLDAPPEEEPS